MVFFTDPSQHRILAWEPHQHVKSFKTSPSMSFFGHPFALSKPKTAMTFKGQKGPNNDFLKIMGQMGDPRNMACGGLFESYLTFLGGSQFHYNSKCQLHPKGAADASITKICTPTLHTPNVSKLQLVIVTLVVRIQDNFL